MATPSRNGCGTSRAKGLASIRLPVSGAAPPRTKALAEIGVAPVRNGPRGQVLCAQRAGHQQLAREKAGWDQLTAAVRLIFNEGA